MRVRKFARNKSALHVVEINALPDCFATQLADESQGLGAVVCAVIDNSVEQFSQADLKSFPSPESSLCFACPWCVGCDNLLNNQEAVRSFYEQARRVW